MTKQTPLEMLTEIQEEKVDEALNLVAICQQTLNRAIEQRDMLYQYRIDYERQFREEAKQGIKPTHLHNYHAFLSKLDKAIEQQEQIVVQLEKQLEKRKEEWVEEKNQLKAYETLQERRDKEQQAKENRREQKLSDEHGAKKHRERLQREQENEQ
jgi:flagellar FliJ protein